MRWMACGALIGAAGVAGMTALVARNPSPHRDPPRVSNDISQLNPIELADIIAPTSTAEIVKAFRSQDGPICIGGGRYSMGGQTAVEGGVQIDMRSFNRIDPPIGKTITVQAGARWRDVQEVLDPYDLSVRVMQSYANFTVGGALSVNAHGRYIGDGPVVSSVQSIQIVLADGTIVLASRDQHPEIFFGAIGGYGGLGVITEATLVLDDNDKVKADTAIMPVRDYRDYFERQVALADDIVFQNANLYPADYDTVQSVVFRKTDEEPTISDRLQPVGDYGRYRWKRVATWIVTEWPFGRAIRKHIIDPRTYPSGHPVVWRNYEASYDVAELEPASRRFSTYVLQEYFIPVDRFDSFVPRLRSILTRHRVNVLNISIRHASADPDTLLSWARSDVFAFVLYYKQRRGEDAQKHVNAWTGELIEAALDEGGAYYLPYQIIATDGQFHRAYPRAREFFALKTRLDPDDRFRNRLWDRYYRPVEVTDTQSD